MSAGRRDRWLAIGTGYGTSTVALPLLSARERARGSLLMGVLAVVVAAVVARAAAPRSTASGSRIAGVLVSASAAVLLGVTPIGVGTVLLGLLAGAGVGLAVGPARRPVSWRYTGLALGLVLLIGVRFALGRPAALVSGIVATSIAAVAALVVPPRPVPPPARNRAVPCAAVLLAAALLAWTGGNDPKLSWFGRVIWHGDRTVRQVALTFDDGPNATSTLAVRDTLDRYGVKATFFLVGRAIDERPDIARALLDDGQLLGNHSYHHDQWRWLDPRYPELDRTQNTFVRTLGVCPRFFRPPHGERTPFVTSVVGDAGMQTITWDVSAADWATKDARLVARRVLERVRPGSIVLLHDGLDGRVGVDRSVIVEALPLILDGLRARDLSPVRLDTLLGGRAYNDSC